MPPKKLRRKMNIAQLSNIIDNFGQVTPLKSEGKQLTFTSVKPRKAPFYIETEVPAVSEIPGQIYNPFLENSRLSPTFKAQEGFSPNLFDENVTVYHKPFGAKKYEIIPKEELFSPRFHNYGISSKPQYNVRETRLDPHTILLPEFPVHSIGAKTFDLTEFNPAINNAKRLKHPRYSEEAEKYDIMDMHRLGYHKRDSDYDSNVSKLLSDKIKLKIGNVYQPTNVAAEMAPNVAQHYANLYGINPKDLTTDEWVRFTQTMLEKYKDQHILFNSSYQPFNTIDPTKLLRANAGFYGKGMYFSDIPANDYGPFVQAFAYPKTANELIITQPQRFFHANDQNADKLLESIRKPMMKYQKGNGSFKRVLWGPWPGMKETSKSPDKWNIFIQNNDINLIKGSISSKGAGEVYPEIVVPMNKIHLLNPIFKHPDELKYGGILKRK